MDTTATSTRLARSGAFGLILMAVGVVLAAFIAWGFVEWAHVSAEATCVVPGRVAPATERVACTTTVLSGGRAFAAALMGVLLGAAASLLPELVGGSERRRGGESSSTTSGATTPRPVLRQPPTAPARPPVDASGEIVVHCIELLDRRDPAVDDVTRQQLERALAEAGCSSFDPTGLAFDRRVHRAVDRVVTDDPATAGTVAITERLGWRRRDQLIRPADVVVNVATDE